MKFIFPCIYAVLLLLAAAYFYRHPACNWDMLPYMSRILAFNQNDFDAVHQETYARAKKEIPKIKYEQLTDSNHVYRRLMFNSADAYKKQFPYYLVKPLYTALAWLAFQWGMTLSLSTIAPGILGWLFTGSLMYFWLNKYLHPAFVLLLSLCIMFSGPMITAATLSTPDMLSAAILFSALYVLLEKESPLLLLILVCVAVFARIDNILWAITLIVFQGRKSGRQETSKGNLFLLSLLPVCCYFTITIPLKTYGWSPSFYSTFTEAFHWKNMLANSLQNLFFSYLPLIVALLLLVLAPILRKGTISADKSFTLVLLGLLVLRLILYPDISDRYFLPWLLVSVILLVRKLMPIKKIHELIVAGNRG